MSTAELKEKLIVEIKNTDDEELLMSISDMLALESNPDRVYEMSKEELDAVNDGIYQIENGMSFSNEEARKIFDKCLGK